MTSVCIACGTYDGSLFALECRLEGSSQETKLLKPVFVDPEAHGASVTSLDLCRDLLVSGSSDESLSIYSISKKQRLGCLEMHTDCVSELKLIRHDPEYPNCNPRHLISASYDACVAMWRRYHPSTDKASTWECIRQMRRHRGPILSLAVHPSNKLALSLSEDKTLRLWNLLRGRQSFALNLKANAQNYLKVLFSPSGDCIMLSSANSIDIVRLVDMAAKKATGAMLSSTSMDDFTADSIFLAEDENTLFAVTGSGRTLTLWRCIKHGLRKKSELAPCGTFTAPGSRIKCLSSVLWPLDSENSSNYLLTVASTDADASYIRGYAVDLNKLADNATSSLAESGVMRLVFTYDLAHARVTKLCTDFIADKFSSEEANLIDGVTSEAEEDMQFDDPSSSEESQVASEDED